MRRIAVFALILLFCTGCTQKPPDAAALAVPYAAASSMHTQVEMAIDCGSRVYDFTVDWRWTSEGSTITILAPESVAGITASAAADGLTLTYGETELVLTDADGSRSPTPPELLPLLYVQWQEGRGLTACEMRNGTEFWTERWEETLQGAAISQCTRFDPETRLPLDAEIYLDGRRAAVCTFVDFTLE